MSHFTSAPKASRAFQHNGEQLRSLANRVPATPPDTEAESMLASDYTLHAAGTSDAGSTRRRAIPYKQTEFRESRNPRLPRWLLVVIPPTLLNLDDTEEDSPKFPTGNRHSSGVLMPLFPTLYGQLAAIAREFNLPSTTGLFVYLQVSEGVMNITPRVTDETWQLLWGHFFIPDQHAPSYPAHQLPIGGRIEFDIDVRKAKWFGAWVRSRGRMPQFSDLQSVGGSHFRRDSRNTTPEDDVDPESEAILSPPTQSLLSAPSGRAHTIRQLSLLDRRQGELPSIRTTSLWRTPQQAPVNSAIAEVDSIPPSRAGLAPASSAKPRRPSSSKEKDIDNMVRTWRQSTPTAIPPVALDLDTGAAVDPLLSATRDSESNTEEPELNLDEYTWTPSSAGPNSWVDGSIDASYVSPSVHLADRLAGSVAMSASTATTWGAPLSYPSTPQSHYRYPSPDIAQRMFEDVPVSPSIATSFGPPRSGPASSVYSLASRYPSPDIAARMLDDSPCTPTTATSWGAPLSYPPSPSSQYRYPSPDLAQRTFEDAPITPSTATSWGPPEFYPDSPIISEGIRTPDIAERLVSPFSEGLGSHVEMSWPYYSAWEVQPYEHIWPDRQEDVDPVTQGDPSILSDSSRVPPVLFAPPVECVVRLAPTYPNLSLYPAVYPAVVPYPTLVQRAENPVVPAQSSHDAELATTTLAVMLGPAPIGPVVRFLPAYPDFSLYPAVYPVVTPYPASVRGKAHVDCDFRIQLHSTVTIARVHVEHETLAPLDALSPSADVAPLVDHPVTSTLHDQPSLRIKPTYPSIDLYPPVYPHNLVAIYPVIFSPTSPPISSAISIQLPHIYPNIQLYSPVYPHNLFSIYPSMYPASAHVLSAHLRPTTPIDSDSLSGGASHLIPRNLVTTYSAIPTTPTTPRISSVHPLTIVRLVPIYPNLEIYAPIYPHNLDTIFPSVGVSLTHHKSKNTLSAPIVASPIVSTPIPDVQPSLVPKSEFHPSQYPYNLFNLYPVAIATNLSPVVDVEISLQSRYPFLNIYPAVYPYLTLYPCLAAQYTSPVIPHPGSLEITAPPPKYKSRKPSLRSHADLHQLVFGNQSHNELHVVPEGVTPASPEDVPVPNAHLPLQQPRADIHASTVGVDQPEEKDLRDYVDGNGIKRAKEPVSSGSGSHSSASGSPEDSHEDEEDDTIVEVDKMLFTMSQPPRPLNGRRSSQQQFAGHDRSESVQRLIMAEGEEDRKAAEIEELYLSEREKPIPTHSRINSLSTRIGTPPRTPPRRQSAIGNGNVSTRDSVQSLPSQPLTPQRSPSILERSRSLMDHQKGIGRLRSGTIRIPSSGSSIPGDLTKGAPWVKRTSPGRPSPPPIPESPPSINRIGRPISKLDTSKFAFK